MFRSMLSARYTLLNEPGNRCCEITVPDDLKQSSELSLLQAPSNTDEKIQNSAFLIFVRNRSCSPRQTRNCKLQQNACANRGVQPVRAARNSGCRYGSPRYRLVLLSEKDNIRSRWGNRCDRCYRSSRF